MKKKIVLLLFVMLTTLSLTTLSLCSRNEAPTTTNVEDNEPGQTLFERHSFDYYYAILVDRETGVCYFERDYPGLQGMTIMLNTDGTPKIWKGEQIPFERYRLDHYYSILVDGETDVCYLEYMGPKMYNIAVMLNSDGTPRIWKEEEK